MTKLAKLILSIIGLRRTPCSIFIFSRLAACPSTFVSATNIIAIQLPAWASLWAAIKMHKAQKQAHV